MLKFGLLKVETHTGIPKVWAVGDEPSLRDLVKVVLAMRTRPRRPISQAENDPQVQQKSALCVVSGAIEAAGSGDCS